MTMDFGNNLKKLRKEKNLTQEELAECLNVSPQTVSKWENNLSMPDITVLPLMADFFGISSFARCVTTQAGNEGIRRAYS